MSWHCNIKIYNYYDENTRTLKNSFYVVTNNWKPENDHQSHSAVKESTAMYSFTVCYIIKQSATTKNIIINIELTSCYFNKIR